MKNTNNNVNMEAVEIMADCIIKYIVKATGQMSYDKTFKARITEVISSDKYKIQYCGNTYTVSSSITCTSGDFVRVCAPCNNWNDLFVVCKTGRNY